jgi:hypothetical protein
MDGLSTKGGKDRILSRRCLHADLFTRHVANPVDFLLAVKIPEAKCRQRENMTILDGLVEQLPDRRNELRINDSPDQLVFSHQSFNFEALFVPDKRTIYGCARFYATVASPVIHAIKWNHWLIFDLVKTRNIGGLYSL